MRGEAALKASVDAELVSAKQNLQERWAKATENTLVLGGSNLAGSGFYLGLQSEAESAAREFVNAALTSVENLSTKFSLNSATTRKLVSEALDELLSYAFELYSERTSQVSKAFRGGHLDFDPRQFDGVRQELNARFSERFFRERLWVKVERWVSLLSGR